MQTQFQLVSYIHACTNETHSLANLQDLIPTLAVFPIIMPAKLWVNLVDLLERVFHLCMHGSSYPTFLMLEKKLHWMILQSI